MTYAINASTGFSPFFVLEMGHDPIVFISLLWSTSSIQNQAINNVVDWIKVVY